jgi:hypothetical protein
MNYSPTDFETMHRYLLGEMDAAEAAAYQGALAHDPALNAALQAERKVIALIQHDARSAMKKMLQAPTPPKAKRRPLMLWFAPLVAIAAVGLWWVLSPGTETLSQLADRFHAETPYHGLDRTSRGKLDWPPLIKGPQWQLPSQIEDTASYLNAHPEGRSLLAEKHLIEGEVLLGKDSAQAAIGHFRDAARISDDEDDALRYAQFYTALAQLKLGQQQAAVNTLKRLQTTEAENLDTHLKAQIAALLEELE